MGCHVKVSKWVGCGKWTKAKRFGRKGKAWFAFKKTTCAKFSERNKKKCEEQCENSKDCKKCTNWSGCGINYKKLKTFKGSGKDWYACQQIDFVNKMNVRKFVDFYQAKKGENIIDKCKGLRNQIRNIV